MDFDLEKIANDAVSNVISSVIYGEFLNSIELKERSAIQDVYRGALQTSLEAALKDLDDIELLRHIAGILKEFLSDKSIADELFWLALEQKRPNKYILRQWFDNHEGYTIETLPINPEIFIETLVKNLVDELYESASEPNNPLHNRMIVQSLWDLRQRLNNPDIFALAHETSKRFIPHGLNKPILRDSIEGNLIQFCLEGNGVVIGKPGVGKSYTLYQISKKLIEQEYPCICLSALYVWSMSELKARLNLQIDFVSYLKSVIPDLKNKKGVILIDGYDAIRLSERRAEFINTVKDIIHQMHPYWHVIVSVRAYDAQQSKTLQDLFPTQSISTEDIKCRHFEIPLLNMEEVQSAIANIKGLKNIYSKSTEPFKQLLKFPFNLWLIEQVFSQIFSNEDYKDLHPISSSTELLTWYWERRIEERRLNSILLQLARKMFEQSTLIATWEQYSPYINDLDELLSLDIIRYISPQKQSIEFSHNILFDYAVARSMPDDSPKSFVSLFEDHLIKAIIFLPSIEFYFAYLWTKDRATFWKMYWGIFITTAPLSLKLSYWIKPLEIIVSQSKNLDDIEPLQRELKNSNPAASKVVNFLFELLLEQDLHDKLLWIDFLELVVETLEKGIIFEFIMILDKFIDITKDTPLFDKCGKISRKLAEWVFKNREDDNLKN